MYGHSIGDHLLLQITSKRRRSLVRKKKKERNNTDNTEKKVERQKARKKRKKEESCYSWQEKLIGFFDPHSMFFCLFFFNYFISYSDVIFLILKVINIATIQLLIRLQIADFRVNT